MEAVSLRSLIPLHRHFHKYLHLLLILAVMDLTGGQWLVLQSVAWVRMIHDFSRQDSVVTAIEKTFDGDHPCDMCQSIDKQKQKEKNQEFVQVKFKKDLYLDTAVLTEHPSALLYEVRPDPSLSLSKNSRVNFIPPRLLS